jgi:hypothetical protein
MSNLLPVENRSTAVAVDRTVSLVQRNLLVAMAREMREPSSGRSSAWLFLPSTFSSLARFNLATTTVVSNSETAYLPDELMWVCRRGMRRG